MGDSHPTTIKAFPYTPSGERSRAVNSVLVDALVKAGYEVEWITAGVLPPSAVTTPSIIVGELAVIEGVRASATFPEAVRWLPVVIEPTNDELAAARARHEQVVVAPGKLSQVVALVEMMAQELADAAQVVP